MNKISKKAYDKKLYELQQELVKLQAWINHTGRRVVIIFEGRDTAGKGGAIKRITHYLNPRTCRVVALPVPNQRETGEWYFQRYVQHLPTSGEIVLFDRSWYNRVGVERVMGYCTEQQYTSFLVDCPSFEKLLVDEGIILIKYWFSVSCENQTKRLKARNEYPTKRWKLSDIDMLAREKYDAYTLARDDMFHHTNSKHAPWYVVDSNIKRNARINVMSHLLDYFDYTDMTPKRVHFSPVDKPVVSSEIPQGIECVKDIAAEIQGFRK